MLAVSSLAGEAGAQTVAKTQDLSFGGFVAGGGGTVTVSPAGARTSGGDVTLLTSGVFAQFSPAVFDISGSALTAYSITLPADGTVSVTSAQGHSMSLRSFTSSPAGSGQLSGSGSQTLSVGATLVVGNSQPSGNYSGSFAVTVVFQ